MTDPINFVEALRNRAQVFAEIVSGRLPDPGVWGGYNRSEYLQGELRTSDMVHYFRPSNPQAIVVFRAIESAPGIQVTRSEPTVIDRQVLDRHEDEIEVPEGVSFSETVSHTFSKARSLHEQVKVGAELQVKATAGISEGINLSGEISAKIYAEYLRTWGEDDSESETVSATLSGTGPMKLHWEAGRERDVEIRTITGHGDLHHSVELIDERLPRGPEFGPVYHLSGPLVGFDATIKGLGPHVWQSDSGPQLVNDFYDIFINRPCTEEELAAFLHPIDASVQYDVQYDNVQKRWLRPI